MEMLTVPQAARRADCGEDKVRRAVKNGALPAQRFGAYWIIEPADLARWMDTMGLRRDPPMTGTPHREDTPSPVRKAPDLSKLPSLK